MRDGLSSALGLLFIVARRFTITILTTKDISCRSNIVKIIFYKEFFYKEIKLLLWLLWKSFFHKHFHNAIVEYIMSNNNCFSRTVGNQNPRK